jgi:hypothetical protein
VENSKKLRDLCASVFQLDFIVLLWRYGFPLGVSIRGFFQGFLKRVQRIKTQRHREHREGGRFKKTP